MKPADTVVEPSPTKKTHIIIKISMAREAMDTNCMTLTRFILAEQKKYAPNGTGNILSNTKYLEKYRL